MTFVHNRNGDPYVRRGELLIRFGGMAPLMSVCVFFVPIAAVATTVFGDHALPTSFYYTWISGFTVIGETCVAAGMLYIGRARAWDCGVQDYLWSGGLTTMLAVLALIVSHLSMAPLLIIPWILPAIGAAARSRLRRSRRQELDGGHCA